MKLTYKHTLAASYTGYITQAAVNNLPPLLFTAFCRDFDISLTQISALISVNFITQFIVDGIMVKGIDKLGLRTSAVAAHILCSLGFLLFGILPFAMNPFAGLCIAMIVNAIGGGLTEVVISPVVEALPGDEKASAMSMLHSFYCWGQVGIVLLSTLYFNLAGIENWRFLPFIWAILPFANTFLFAKVPLCNLIAEDEEPLSVRELFSMKLFPVLVLLMVCAGASELAMSQWSSYFAETGLQVSKTAGDLLGPCGFAVLMGCARLIYGIKGSKIPLNRFICGSCLLCTASYMTAVFSPNPVLSLIGCAVCGFSVGILWPGTFSIASKHIPRGGNAMFALLALAGDAGCASGPAVIGLVSDKTGSFKTGILLAAIFPVLMLITMAIFFRDKKES